MKKLLFLATFIAFAIQATSAAASLLFSGYTWQVRSGTGGPGPNNWDSQNVWVDSKGYLHVKLAHRNGQWSGAELYTDQRLGFGTYQFKIIGRPDLLDDNVVLGLFNYTTPDIGPDGTNEIDIEFATWGGAQRSHGNWTVWPAMSGVKQTTQAFDVKLPSTSTHRFTWTSYQVAYEALAGSVQVGQSTGLLKKWVFAPQSFLVAVPQNPLPLHINLWLFQGHPPKNGQEVEIVISEFSFTPK